MTFALFILRRAVLGAVVFGLIFTAEAQNAVQVEVKKEAQGVAFVASSIYDTDYTVTLEITQTENVEASCPLPVTVASTSSKALPLCHLRIINTGRKWHYNYHYHYIQGTPRGTVGRPSASSPFYILPFRPGETHKVIQGNLGAFSHYRGSLSEYAVDWSADIGTTVCAARGGVVTGVKQDSNEGGVDDSFKPKGNYVIIRHEDGTYAEYYHLKLYGALVNLGEEVITGQAIGRSGATGYAAGPHLHFSVFQALDGYKRESLPYLLKTAQGTFRSLDLQHNQPFSN